jgi:hypothetical protein
LIEASDSSEVWSLSLSTIDGKLKGFRIENSRKMEKNCHKSRKIELFSGKSSNSGEKSPEFSRKTHSF